MIATIMFIKQMITTFGGPILENYLCKVRYPKETVERVEKIEKLKEHIVKIIYHTIMNSLHYHIIKDAKYLHWSFGGKYEDLEFFENYPCLELPKYQYDIYCAILAYYTQELLTYIIFNRHRYDFAEMSLHHFLTVVLVGFSYTTN